MINLNEFHPLYKELNSVSNVSINKFLIILNNFKEVAFSKKELIIKPGDLNSFQFFLVKGCVRFYLINKDGKEQTVEFAVENSWICNDQTYFVKNQSILYVECIEDCNLLMIEKVNWESLNKEIPVLRAYSRIILELKLSLVYRNIIMNSSLNYEERYSNLLIDYPNIENRIENKYIASFLNLYEIL